MFKKMSLFCAILGFMGTSFSAFAVDGYGLGKISNWRYQPTEFFRNAKRRNAEPDEQRSIAKNVIFDANGKKVGHCTSFFVKNDQNKTYMATARHCVDYKFTDACDKGLFKLEFTNKSETVVGSCKSVIAGSVRDDLIVFEAIFEKDISQEMIPLTLTYGIPPQKTYLKTMGFPLDKYRKGELTVTENCWVNDGKNPVTYEELDNESREAINNAEPNDELAKFYSSLEVKFVFSNCTVYGGNSGGPVLIDKTNYVIGLPHAYWPHFYSEVSEKASMKIESSEGFVRRNLNTLKAAGIVLVNLNLALSI